jgi:hypothetical protein
MVQRFLALAGSRDEDLQLIADLGLPDVLIEMLGAQRAFDRLFVGRGRRRVDDALFGKMSV